MAMSSKRGRLKRRNTNLRKRKNVAFIALEGNNKTERYYLDALSRRHQNYMIHHVGGNYTDPVKMVKQLVSEFERDSMEGDIGFCLVDSDFDSSKNRQLEKADKLVRNTNIKVIVSSPCFEIWYICHYVYSTKQYGSTNEVLSKLREYIGNYSKESTDIFCRINQNIDEAISNAKRLEQYHLANHKKLHRVEFSPSTEIYKIIELLTDDKELH